MAPERGLLAGSAKGSLTPRSNPREDQPPPTAQTEESGGIAPDWSSDTGEVDPRGGGNDSAQGNAFHAGMMRLLSMHDEVQEEVTQLRDLVAHYEGKLKHLQGAMLCSVADAPEKAALMETVSRELAVLPEAEDARDLTSRTRSNEGPFQPAARVFPLAPPVSPRQPADGRTEQRQSSKKLPSRHVTEPLDDDLDPRTALALGAQGAEQELAILDAPPMLLQGAEEVEDDPLHTRRSSGSSGQKRSTLQVPESIPRSSGSKGPADNAATTPVDSDAPPRIQDEQTNKRNTMQSSASSKKAEEGRALAVQDPRLKHQTTMLRTQRTRQSLIAGLVGDNKVEDLPISERLDKERAAVLTPASKRVMARLNRDRKKKKTNEDGDEIVQEETWFFKNLRTIVQHNGFDLSCALVIVLNSAMIGIEVDWKTRNDGEMPHMKSLNYVCTVFFLVELILRMMIDGLYGFFVSADNKKWNVFDAVLVGMSLLDAVIIDLIGIGADATGVSGGLKTLKMLRIVRICRVFRFFGELSQLALMIIDSVTSLIWALVMLFIVIYVFAIFFIHGVTDKLRSTRDMEADPAQQDAIRDHFGSLWTTFQTLFQSMLNGISWYTLTDALSEIHLGWAVLFLFYIAFTMLAVLNIITGVFVDNAVETARTQREYLVQKEMELKEKWCQEMRSLFNEMDTDGSGTVCLSEVKDFFNDARVRSYFIALGLETQDAERLFVLLDEEETGDIDVDVFLSGCLRLKGNARSIDVYQLLQDYRKMNNRLLDLQEAVCKALKAPFIRTSVSAIVNGVQTPKGGGSKNNSETRKSDSRRDSGIVKQSG